MDDSSDNPALELYESDSLMWSRCSYSDSSSFDSSLVVTLEYYNKGGFQRLTNLCNLLKSSGGGREVGVFPVFTRPSFGIAS